MPELTPAPTVVPGVRPEVIEEYVGTPAFGPDSVDRD